MAKTQIDTVGLARDVGKAFGELYLETLRPVIDLDDSPIRIFIAPIAGGAPTDMNDRELERRLPEISLAVAQVAEQYGLNPSNFDVDHYELRIR